MSTGSSSAIISRNRIHSEQLEFHAHVAQEDPSMHLFRSFGVAMLLVFASASALAQLNTFHLGDTEYRQVNGVWHLWQDGSPRCEIDPRMIAFRMKDRAILNRQHLAALNIDSLVEIKTCIAHTYWLLGVRDASKAFMVARALQESAIAEDVRFDVVFEPHHVAPGDPNYYEQWHLRKIHADDAWDITTGDSSIVVAIIDAGAQYDHEDLAANAWPGIGYKFIPSLRRAGVGV
jgi:hypothetical protein